MGINSCIYFKALPGEMASSCLELRNEGNTAVFYSWQKLRGSFSISHLLPHRTHTCFYFNQSPGGSRHPQRAARGSALGPTGPSLLRFSATAVILPGDTQQIDLVFKSLTPGLHTESWQLETRPRLLQSASVQVTLMGLALYQDRTVELRRHLEVLCAQSLCTFQDFPRLIFTLLPLHEQTRLEETVTQNFCRLLLCKILEGIQTPERPRTLTEFLMESPPVRSSFSRFCGV